MYRNGSRIAPTHLINRSSVMTTVTKVSIIVYTSLQVKYV